MKNVSVKYPYHLPIASIQYMYQTEHWPVSTTQFLINLTSQKYVPFLKNETPKEIKDSRIKLIESG